MTAPETKATAAMHLQRLLWVVVLLAALPASLLASWQLLAGADFFYPYWYGTIGIDKTIAEYGPKNRYRNHFEDTTRDERIRLFSAIVAAIHDEGRGLEGLTYHDASGRAVAPLLRPPEITHLRDVSRLVDVLYRVGLGGVLIWIAALTWLWRLRLPAPPLGRYLAGLGLSAIIFALGVLAAGPKKVFYAAHTLIFPAGHQWFFYYEDSLMTMLMKAPDLFAAIAAEWLPLAALCYWLGIRLSRRLLRRAGYVHSM